MEEAQLLVLAEGVDAREVAEDAACCAPGVSNNLRTAPDA